MKKISLLVGVMLLIGLSILGAGCSSAAQAEVSNNWIWVEKYCEDFQDNTNINDSIEIHTGDTLVIVLCSNPTTGFTWSEEASITNNIVLTQENHEFTGQESETPPPPGTPGLESWRLKALQPGTSTVSLEYSRPWEGGEKGEWTFTLEVTVK